MKLNLSSTLTSLIRNISLTLALVALLPSCAGTTTRSLEKQEHNQDFIAAKAKVISLLEGNFSVAKNVIAVKVEGLVSSSIITTTRRYSAVSIAASGNMHFIENSSTVYVNPEKKSNNKSTLTHYYEFEIPLTSLDPTLLNPMHSHANSASYEDLVTQWALGLNDKTTRETITQKYNGKHPVKSAAAVLYFQSEAKARQFADALRVLINTMNGKW